MNFNEIFRKIVTYDNIKSHQKSGLLPLSRKKNFRKRDCLLGSRFRLATI